MFSKIVEKLNLDKDYPKRSHMIDLYTRVYNGELYDQLPYAFCDEYDIMGKYVPLHFRQPSVQYNLCKLVVDESASLLFGKNHFPEVHVDNDLPLTQELKTVLHDLKIRKVMMEAAITGSTGSVVLFLRIISGKLEVEVKNTQYLTPVFNPEYPCQLIRLVEKYKVKGSELAKQGYSGIESDSTDYWFKREWDAEKEIYYVPFREGESEKIDEKRTVKHDLGFVPAIWIKNLPKPSSKGYQQIDGMCTYSSVINISIEIDYLLSQGGRGLKYSSDPLVVFKVQDDLTLSNNSIDVSGDVSGAKKIVRSASNALILNTQDDAKLLEINGKACHAVIEHTRYLRELALESIHGNRSNADKVTAAQSGLAMQAMNQPLIWLADMLRIYYGDEGLIPLTKMIILASQKQKIIVNGKVIGAMNPNCNLTLKWPDWYPATPMDRVQHANALKTLKDGAMISTETAVKSNQEIYGFPSVPAEIALIEEDQKKLAAMQPQVKENINA